MRRRRSAAPIDAPTRGAHRSFPYRVRIPVHGIIELSADVVIGRAPTIHRVPSGELRRLIAVPSPQRYISAQHLELARVGDQIIATDLDSTNGTVITSTDGGSLVLSGGASVVLGVGDIIDLGDDVAIEFLEPAVSSVFATAEGPAA